MQSFLRAVELWKPDEAGTSLEFAGGIYNDDLEEFREISELALFAYDHGLPGKAWAAGHPIILTDFADSYFRRADEAKLFGLTCAVAIPVFRRVEDQVGDRAAVRQRRRCTIGRDRTLAQRCRAFPRDDAGRWLLRSCEGF